MNQHRYNIDLSDRKGSLSWMNKNRSEVKVLRNQSVTCRYIRSPSKPNDRLPGDGRCYIEVSSYCEIQATIQWFREYSRSIRFVRLSLDAKICTEFGDALIICADRAANCSEPIPHYANYLDREIGFNRIEFPSEHWPLASADENPRCSAGGTKNSEILRSSNNQLCIWHDRKDVYIELTADATIFCRLTPEDATELAHICIRSYD